MAGKGSSELKLSERIIIEEMLRAGAKTGTIAASLSRSHSGVKCEIRRSGGRENYCAHTAQKISDLNKENRIRALRKGFSEEEARLITAGVGEGWSRNKIATNVGCTHHRLRQFLKQMDMKTLPKNYVAFEERISALEQQVEIILEIMEKKND